MNKLAAIGRAMCIAGLCAACGAAHENAASGGSAGSGAHSGHSGKPSKPSTNAAKDAGSPAADSGEGPSGSSPEPLDSGMSAGNLPSTIPSLRGKCDLHSGFAGDDACLGVPDPDKGFQIHVGPDSYDAAAVAPFLMQPGDESDECYMKKSPNDKDILYYVWELSGRPGTHHIINSTLTSDLPEGFAMCSGGLLGDGASMGSLGGASRPHMPPRPVAPENEHLGIPLPAHMQVQHDMHWFNITDKPVLREFWINLYYVDASQVKERPNQIAGLGGFSWNYTPIQPGTHNVFKYECPINADGRIIQLLGHTHAHGVRETAHIRNAKGDRLKVFEQYDYLSPQIFDFDSVTQNPDFSDSAPGAFTGILKVSKGDTLEWECEVNNDSNTALRYINSVHSGEMCNIWGASVGPAISCFLQ